MSSIIRFNATRIKSLIILQRQHILIDGQQQISNK